MRATRSGTCSSSPSCLTGSGINAGNPPKIKPEWARLYHREGAFEFNPARHDFSTKVVLGRTIQGRGFAEVDEAVTWIVKQPACAHFISRELATYFVADNPPPQLVDRMAKTFQRTDGDIAAVLREMLLSPELDAALGAKFKDPTRFVHLGRALRLRRAHHHQHASPVQLAEWSRRDAVRARRRPTAIRSPKPRGRARAR